MRQPRLARDRAHALTAGVRRPNRVVAMALKLPRPVGRAAVSRYGSPQITHDSAFVSVREREARVGIPALSFEIGADDDGDGGVAVRVASDVLFSSLNETADCVGVLHPSTVVDTRRSVKCTRQGAA